jgi:hypothetical protein
VNPLQHLLAASRVLPTLPAAAQRTITGRRFFPELISGPFHHGLVVVFTVAAALGHGRRRRLSAARWRPGGAAPRSRSWTARPDRGE